MEIQPKPTPSGVGLTRSRKQKRTHASLFILESVGFEDETEGRLEGDILSQILGLAGKPTDYLYIRTRAELAVAIPRFATSGHRYLHISCHGNEDAIFTTLDAIPFDELGQLLRPHMTGRRLFLSACSAVNDALASAVMRKAGCNSIIGPAEDIGFDEAAVMWSSFYHLMFRQNPKVMKARGIEMELQRVVRTFDVPMTYIRRTSQPPYWRRVELD